MNENAANLLGALGLAISDRIGAAARDTIHHGGETPAALVVIGYGTGPSNDVLGSILGLTHPGTVRLVDRLVTDGLVERRKGKDRRTNALFLTQEGVARREVLLEGRMQSMQMLLQPLSKEERATFEQLLGKVLGAIPTTDLDKRKLCRMCDRRACNECPIPADF